VLVRIWRTGVEDARLAEYGEFERERSLPMFWEQRGLLGVLFLREADDRAAALTFWEDEEAIQALATSPSYNRTVEALLATGLLRGEQTVEVFEVKDGELLMQELVRALRS
jgi:heme-degrading monooxygenase HmoA